MYKGSNFSTSSPVFGIFFSFVFNNLCVCLFVVVLGLRGCAGFSPAVGAAVVLQLRCAGSSGWRCLVAKQGPWSPGSVAAVLWRRAWLLRSCGARAQGLVASQRLESSRNREQTLVYCMSCIRRRILYHCATWEALFVFYTEIVYQLREKVAWSSSFVKNRRILS